MTLPRTQESVEKTYRYIEGTSKKVWGEHCEDHDSDKEVYLVEGSCLIACGGRQCKGGCKLLLPSRRRLENVGDWSDVEAVVHNYEQGDEQHKDIRIIIRRKLDLCKKTDNMTELPPDIRDWMYLAIDKEMVSSASEKSQEYIPKDKLQAMTSENIVRRVVETATDIICHPQAREKLIDDIYRKAPILLAICVYTGVPLTLLEAMLGNGMDDTEPLTRDPPDWLKGMLHQNNRSLVHYKRVFKEQWSFRAVVFDIVGKDYKLHADEIVPFISKQYLDGGSFSMVYKIRLHRCHHRLYTLPDVSNIQPYCSPVWYF